MLGPAVQPKFYPSIHYTVVTESVVTHRAEGISRDQRGNWVIRDLCQKLQKPQDEERQSS